MTNDTDSGYQGRAGTRGGWHLGGARTCLLLIVLLGFVLRLGWLIHARPEPVSDFAEYRNLAFALLDTGIYEVRGLYAFRPPGYPVFLAAAALVSRDDFWLSLVNVIAASSIPPLLYWLAHLLGFPRRTGLIAAAIAAVYPPYVLFASNLASEHLFLPLLLVVCGLTLSGSSEPSHLRVTLAGALVGLLVLVRGDGLFYLPVIFALLVVGLRSRWAAPSSRVALKGAAFFGAIVVLVAPWVVRNAVVVGAPTISTNAGGNLYMAHNPDEYGYHPLSQTPLGGLSESEQHRFGIRLAIDYVVTHPDSLLASTEMGTAKLYSRPFYGVRYSRSRSDDRSIPNLRRAGAASDFAWAALGTLAACALLVRRQWTTLAAVWAGGLVLCNWFGYAVLLFGNPRYRMAADLGLFLAAAVSLSRLTERTAAVQPPGQPTVHPPDDRTPAVHGVLLGASESTRRKFSDV